MASTKIGLFSPGIRKNFEKYGRVAKNLDTFLEWNEATRLQKSRFLLTFKNEMIARLQPTPLSLSSL